jgi:integrase
MSRRKLPGGWITRKNGATVWRLPYATPEGVKTSRVFSTKGDAAAFYDELQVGTRAGTWVRPDAGRERFVDYAATWADAQDWAPSTRESFGSHLRRLGRYMASTRLDQVDQLRLQRLRNELVRDYSLSTATITLHYAAAIMRSAHVTRRVPADVTIGVKPPVRRGDDASDRVGPDDVPTRDEVVAIIAATEARYRAAVVLGACGLRVSEALGATVEQFDSERRTLTVDRQLQRIDGRVTHKRPKREKVRSIELPSWAALELRRHLRDHGPFWSLDSGGPALLFRGGRDAPMRRDAFYVGAWRPALIAVGLAPDRYVFHSLRHWCASSLLSAGAPITAVAGHLGDVPETVMRTYAHWLRDERHLPATLLDQLLAGASMTDRIVTAE